MFGVNKFPRKPQVETLAHRENPWKENSKWQLALPALSTQTMHASPDPKWKEGWYLVTVCPVSNHARTIDQVIPSSVRPHVWRPTKHSHQEPKVKDRIGWMNHPFNNNKNKLIDPEAQVQAKSHWTAPYCSHPCHSPSHYYPSYRYRPYQMVTEMSRWLWVLVFQRVIAAWP